MVVVVGASCFFQMAVRVSGKSAIVYVEFREKCLTTGVEGEEVFTEYLSSESMCSPSKTTEALKGILATGAKTKSLIPMLDFQRGSRC